VRASILTKATIAIGVLAGAAMIAGAVGVAAFNHLRDVVPRFAESEAENLATVQRLTSDVGNLVGIAPQFASARTLTSLSTINDSVHDTVRQLYSTLDTLSEGLTGETLESAQVVRQTGQSLEEILVSLDDLVTRKIETQARFDNGIRALWALHEKIECALIFDPKSGPTCDADLSMSQLSDAGRSWLSAAHQVSGKFRQYAVSRERPGARRVERALDRMIGTLRQQTATLPAADSTRLLPLSTGMSALFDGPDGLVGATRELVSLERQLRGRVNKSKYAASKFTSAMTALVSAVRKDTADRKLALTQLLDRLTVALLAIVAACITMAALGFIFFKNQIIQRLVSLQSAVQAGVNGVTADDYPHDDKDEIGKLGQAYSYFVDEIDSREDSLRRERDMAQRMASKAEAASQAKSMFLANMSHELRTPLNSIIGFSQIMSDGSNGMIDAKYAGYAQDINNSGQHLLDVINDILDISKIEAGEIELDESAVDIGVVIEASIKMVQVRSQNKKQRVFANLDSGMPALHGDGRLLRQVMVNLLSNAIKFTPEGGHIRINAGLDGQGGITLKVEDTGIGIAREDIPKALEPFSQVRTGPDITHDGTGLGLSLSRQLVELHDGTLSIDSEVGAGTVVTISLPPERTLQTSNTEPSRANGAD